MRFVWLWQLLVSVLGGVLIALGLAPWNVSWLIWVAFVPILVSLLALRGRAVLIILQGILFSGTFGLIAFHWLWKEHRYQELGTILGVFSLQGVIWGWFVWRFCKLPELAKPDEKKGKKKLEPLFIGAAGKAEAWGGSPADLRGGGVVLGSSTLLGWGGGIILTTWNPAGLPGASKPPLPPV